MCARGAEDACHHSLNERHTALVSHIDMIAIDVLQGPQKTIVRLPAELSVTGFDNTVFSAHTSPSLTPSDQPKRSIWAEVARLVLELVNAPQAEGTRIRPHVLILKRRLVVLQQLLCLPQDSGNMEVFPLSTNRSMS